MTDHLKPIKVVFLVLPQVHLIDLAGPVQVFYEANQFGARFNLEFCSYTGASVMSQQGLPFGAMKSFEEISLRANDFLFVPGIEFTAVKKGSLRQGYEPLYEWLQALSKKGVNMCSVCSGAFILAEAGILKGHTITTHWKCIDYLKEHYRGIDMVNDELFVREGNVFTSAGMTSGIDLALSIIEEKFGPVITSRVAREMVVFLRRTGQQSQQSVYLDFRTHIHPAIHQVQDHMIQHPTEPHSIEKLAAMVHMSPRNLTRLFKKHTAISINDFKSRCRLAHAETLLKHPGLTMDHIAGQCGFKDARQFRRMWKRHHGNSPSQVRS